MKKIILAITLASFFSLQVFSQEFKEGDKVLNLGLGLGSTLYAGSYYNTSIPPLSASLEFGIKDGVLEKGSIGVGAYAGFTRYKYQYLDWGYKYSNFILGARGLFHYPLLEKLDTYTGLLVGFQIVSAKEFGDALAGWNYNASSGGLIGSWFIGGRYYFNESLAGMLELGYGISYMNLGIALRIN